MAKTFLTTKTLGQDVIDNPDKYPLEAVISAQRMMNIKRETDPLGIGQHAPGAKMDEGKTLAGVLSDFSHALMAVAEIGTFGANKYSRGGWQSVPDGVTRYTDALWRHLLKERHEAIDKDSDLKHAAHLAWNALARLELILRDEKENPEINRQQTTVFV